MTSLRAVKPTQDGSPTAKTSKPRHVRRISGIAHAGLQAHITVRGGRTFNASVVDFSSESIAVALANQAAFEACQASEILALVIQLGKMVVGEIHHPTRLRTSPEKRLLVVQAQTSYRNSGTRTGARFSVSQIVAPVATSLHPLRRREKLHLKLIDFSRSGLRFQTSLSNKFLLPGIVLEKTEIVFPCLGLEACDLTVRYVKSFADHLEVGCAVSKSRPRFETLLGQFALFGSQEQKPVAALVTTLRSQGFAIKELGDAVRIRPIESMEEYDQVLSLRFVAYSQVGKVLPNATPLMMADMQDDRSNILVATVGGQIVGTVRIVKTHGADEPLPFEEYLEMPAKLIKQRQSLVEISRLATLPELHGTDLVLRLFQAAAREVILQGGVAVCLATTQLRRHYQRLGAKVISREVPHPVVPNESLALLIFERAAFLRGKDVSGLAWERVGRDVIRELAHFGVVSDPGFSPTKWLQARAEAAVLYASRALSKVRVRRPRKRRA